MSTLSYPRVARKPQRRAASAPRRNRHGLGTGISDGAKRDTALALARDLGTGCWASALVGSEASAGDLVLRVFPRPRAKPEATTCCHELPFSAESGHPAGSRGGHSRRPRTVF